MKYKSKIPWPQEGETMVVPRDQPLTLDSRDNRKVILVGEGCEDGIVVQRSVWPTQLGAIADFFVRHPKVKTVLVRWERDESVEGVMRIKSVVENLDSTTT